MGHQDLASLVDDVYDSDSDADTAHSVYIPPMTASTPMASYIAAPSPGFLPSARGPA